MVFVLVHITLCPFLFCNHFNEKEKTGCLLLSSLCCLYTVNVLLIFLTVPWIGLQYMSVVFPDRTHLLLVK